MPCSTCSCPCPRRSPGSSACPRTRKRWSRSQDKDLHTYGFLGYPVLQAADILIYKAHFVPVGTDQLPHLELTREICRRFNQFYGGVFPEPQPLMTEYPKLPGTDGRKMSKSYNNCLYLSDSPEELVKKVMQMVTDPARVRRQDPGNPDVCPLFTLDRIFAPKEWCNHVNVECRRAGIGCVDDKKELLKHLLAYLKPLQETTEGTWPPIPTGSRRSSPRARRRPAALQRRPSPK